MRFFGMYPGFTWIGLVFNIVLLAALITALILLVIWAIRGLRRPSLPPGSPSQTGLNPTGSPGPTPKEVAQMRYARGEINREQYQQILSDLEH